MEPYKRVGKRDEREMKGNSSADCSSGSQKSKRRKKDNNQEEDGGAVKKMRSPSPVEAPVKNQHRILIKTPAYFENTIKDQTIKLSTIERDPLERDTYEVGSWVFALWKDGRYYAGVISSIPEKSEKMWTVDFYDGETTEVEAKQILPIKVVGAGTECYGDRPGSKHLHLGRVIGQHYVNIPEGSIVEYAVKWQDKKPISFCVRNQLVFHEDHAKTIKKKLGGYNQLERETEEEAEDEEGAEHEEEA